MSKSNRHRILVATDGSPSAEEALAVSAKFPWPEDAAARIVVARFPWLEADSEAARMLLEASVQTTAKEAQARLRRRWEDVAVTIASGVPEKVILTEAENLGSSTIVLGWRGHGKFRRLLAGSVSRAVAAQAACAVLVARKAPATANRFLLAYDGSAESERAVDYLTRLAPRKAHKAVIVTAVQPQTLPGSVSRLPSHIRNELAHGVSEENEQRRGRAKEAALAAGGRLKAAGWSVSTDIRTGAPVASVMEALIEHHADVVVVGASVKKAVQRMVLGSVAEALLDRSPVPVLIAR